jgi:hypothetical protein
MTQPLSVAAALARGCFFCKRPLAPEAALLVTATWELVEAPQNRMRAQPGVCCQGCFDKHSNPEDRQSSGAGEVMEVAGPTRFALYDFDAEQLATIRVFDSKSEAADVANTLNDVIVVPLPVEPRSQTLAEEDESEPCECAAQAITAPKLKLTLSHRNFFDVEIRNELSGGVSPATLDSAVESLEQAPNDLIVEWCDDEAVTKETMPDFVASVVAMRDQFGGHVELRALSSD